MFCCFGFLSVILTEAPLLSSVWVRRTQLILLQCTIFKAFCRRSGTKGSRQNQFIFIKYNIGRSQFLIPIKNVRDILPSHNPKGWQIHSILHLILILKGKRKKAESSTSQPSASISLATFFFCLLCFLIPCLHSYWSGVLRQVSWRLTPVTPLPHLMPREKNIHGDQTRTTYMSKSEWNFLQR